MYNHGFGIKIIYLCYMFFLSVDLTMMPNSETEGHAQLWVNWDGRTSNLFSWLLRLTRESLLTSLAWRSHPGGWVIMSEHEDHMRICSIYCFELESQCKVTAIQVDHWRRKKKKRFFVSESIETRRRQKSNENTFSKDFHDVAAWFLFCNFAIWRLCNRKVHYCKKELVGR